MTEELISKKDILEETGISYGQFYRWKRKGLIPDTWIIHKSTRTGQESFLPKEKILTRIGKIKELKEENTLSEIADLLSPEIVEKKYEKSAMSSYEWFDAGLIKPYEEIVGPKKHLSFSDLLNLKVFSRLKEAGLRSEPIYLALETLVSEGNRESFSEKLIVAEKSFSSSERENLIPEFCLLTDGEVNFDQTVDIIEVVDLAVEVKEIKLNMRENPVN